MPVNKHVPKFIIHNNHLFKILKEDSSEKHLLYICLSERKRKFSPELELQYQEYRYNNDLQIPYHPVEFHIQNKIKRLVREETKVALKL